MPTIEIKNGVIIASGYITVIREGEIVREYLTPRDGQYVKYWRGEGPACIGVQEFNVGKTGSHGWAAGARTWPSSDVEECAKWIAGLWRLRFMGRGKI